MADLQGNVNPFVVEPNLVEYIWGTMKGKAYDCDAEVETPDPGTVDGAITCQEARELALALSSGISASQSGNLRVNGLLPIRGLCLPQSTLASFP